MIGISSQFLPARRKKPRRRGHSSRSFEWWIYSDKLRWGPALWLQIQSCQGCFFLQVIEYLVDHHRVFDTGDDPDITTAFAAAFNIDLKYPLVYALGKNDFMVLFPVNPLMVARFREAFATSGAKDDPSDAQLQLELLLKHRDRLKPLKPSSPSIRAGADGRTSAAPGR